MSIYKKLEKINRRVFLKRVIKSFFLFISLIFPFLGLTILKPTRPKRKDLKFFEVPEDKYPKEGVKKVDIKIDGEKYFKIFLVKNSSNALIALSPVCTHLGCFVNFDRNTNEFICPCHGGRYDIEGKVIAGPPKEPLQRLPVKIENKRIFVGLKI